MQGYLYLIQSLVNQSYYIGSSIDPNKRLVEHNYGINKSTANLKPWVLVFTRKYNDIKIARKIEYQLKKLKSRKIIEKIIKDKYIKLGS